MHGHGDECYLPGYCMLYVVCLTVWDGEDGNESNDQNNRPDDNNSGSSGGGYKLKRSPPGGRIREIRETLMIICITIVRTK